MLALLMLIFFGGGGREGNTSTLNKVIYLPHTSNFTKVYKTGLPEIFLKQSTKVGKKWTKLPAFYHMAVKYTKVP
jgi:hypothetical protein